MVDTPWAKTTLNNLESPSLAENHVGGWYTDVVEGNVTVAMWGVVITEHRQHAVDSDARSVMRNKNNGLLLVLILVVWVRFA